jgi:hypothetical protein
MPGVDELVRIHKLGFIDRLVQAVADAGAFNLDQRGFPLSHARSAAEVLIDAAIPD